MMIPLRYRYDATARNSGADYQMKCEILALLGLCSLIFSICLALIVKDPASTTGAITTVTTNTRTITTTTTITITTTASRPVEVGKWSVFEIDLTSTNSYSNRYLDVCLSATFTHQVSRRQIIVEGFWDGGNCWKIRMAPTMTGVWTYSIISNDNQLNGKTGSFVCVDSLNKGFIQVNPDRPYTFMYADRTPWFLMGDTLWSGNSILVNYKTRFKSYVDLRASQRFNYIQSVILVGARGPFANVDDQRKNEGGYLFLNNLDKDYLNPAYFQWVDKRVEYIMGKGMVYCLFFSWSQDWSTFSNDQAERFLRYIVARYSAFNVFWSISGEWNEANDAAFYNNLGQVLTQKDPYDHPTTIHPTGGGDAFGIGTPSWLFYGMQQKGMQQKGGTNLNQEIQNERKYNRPVVNGEYGYLFGQYMTGKDNEYVRTRAWQIVTGGGFFVNGFRNTYCVPKGNWHLDDSNDARVGEYFKILYDFFTTRTHWWEMDPNNNLADNGYALAKIGHEYVIYLQNGGPVHVNLAAATGTLHVEWYNPRDGTYSGQTTVHGGATRTFTAPDSNDWVLHIEKFRKYFSQIPMVGGGESLQQ